MERKPPKPPSTNRKAIDQQRRSLRLGILPDTSLTPEEQRRSDEAIETFVKVLGGRAKLTEALAVTCGDADLDEIAMLLLDPRYEGFSVRRLCALANLTVVDLFRAYRHAVIVRAQIEATQTIAQKLLPVVEDVMTRAAPYPELCGVCGGSGSVANPDQPAAPPVTCETCLGHGKVLRLPDLDRQKLALELAQLVQRQSGVNILQQTLVQTPSASAPHGTLDQLQKVVGDLLSRPPIIDVEAEPEPEPAEPPREAPPSV